jgi:hypothetical protein
MVSDGTHFSGGQVPDIHASASLMKRRIHPTPNCRVGNDSDQAWLCCVAGIISLWSGYTPAECRNFFKAAGYEAE